MLAALVPALFTLAFFFFHNERPKPAEQQMMFMKNLGMVAGLLALAALGAGADSLDARRRA